MNWIKIFETRTAALEALPENHPRLLRVSGLRICLVRRGAEIYAVQDRCTHNGASLSNGIVNYLGEIVCPLHQYQFDLKTGRSCGQRASDLVSYPLRETDDGILIGI